jgi:large subunit ribosomal protein L17
MRHRIAHRRLGRPSDQRRALLRSLVGALFEHDRIRTTLPKAKEAQPIAEKLITLAKRGDLHARRQVLRYLPKLRGDTLIVNRLFEEIAPRYQDRDGGYTRIIRAGYRAGDAAPMAVLELLD